MFQDAIKCFDKAIKTHFQRVSIFEGTFKGAKEAPSCDNVLQKAVYNLTMIHNHLGNTDIVKQLINDYLYIKE